MLILLYFKTDITFVHMDSHEVLSIIERSLGLYKYPITG